MSCGVSTNLSVKEACAKRKKINLSPNKQNIAKQVKVCETGYPVSLGSETVCHENNRQMAFYLPLIRYFTLI